MSFLRSLLCICFLLTLSPAFSSASNLEHYQFVKLSPQDQKAVVKTPEGKLELVGIGAVIAGDCQVVEVTEGRIVLERPSEEGTETIILRFDGKHQRIERIRPRGEKPPVLVAPAG